MKKYNFINNLDKYFKKKYLVGIDKDKSPLNLFINAIIFIISDQIWHHSFFRSLSLRGKLIYSVFYLITFVIIPLIFIIILLFTVFIGFKVFNY